MDARTTAGTTLTSVSAAEYDSSPSEYDSSIGAGEGGREFASALTPVKVEIRQPLQAVLGQRCPHSFQIGELPRIRHAHGMARGSKAASAVCGHPQREREQRLVEVCRSGFVGIENTSASCG